MPQQQATKQHQGEGRVDGFERPSTASKGRRKEEGKPKASLERERKESKAS